ncbi:MAG: 3-hydroxyacyl-CoA dehydrogenase NAD-binding domain-containing protein [Bryobacteraceae bacterium]|nr:3-hydroxyacyl-CoA dehydrogenase NAD-binding domain-containing protein [Bryobacteraceae bacterium]MDW8377556.1 3-hydroxyacyl-CoA dehydrogenase NAD-binding domain-containing protein [Bryobacterales bacterium]
MSLVRYSRSGAVATITIDNPPVNALSPGVPEGISEGLQKAIADPEVVAVVLIGGGRTFIAGADIQEFRKIHQGQAGSLKPLLRLLTDLEESPKPVVAAIHGTALGGGLEVAMACHYRVAVASAQLGQPEVKLGLIPGGEGTQRLPRLVGVAKALEMCVFGEPIGAKEALQAGILDEIVEGELLDAAVAYAQRVAHLPPPKTSARTDKLGDPEANAAAIATVREAAQKRMRGQTAPLAAIEAIEAATKLPFREGCQREQELFAACLASDQSKALVHVFFAERTVGKIPGLGRDVQPLALHRAAVVGAGTMGSGIAMVYANAGIPVLLKDSTESALTRGMNSIRTNYANSVKKGRFSQQDADKRLALITPTLSYDGFEQADVIVEAVFENMALKKQVFAEIDAVAKPDAVLASNTSTLNIDEIASATQRPESVIGHHFFSPAHVMRLLEIVRGRATSDRIIVTSLELAKRLRKVGVVVGNCRGFVGNRMFAPYCREAIFLVEEGNPPEQVDQALYEFGMAMGPLAVQDLAGLDVGWRIRKEFKHTEIPGIRYPELDSLLCEQGFFGQKTGAGFYRYDENRKPSPHPRVMELAREYAAKAGIPQTPATPQEILERCLYALINEGAALLAEGIALRSVDIDIIYIHGYGFPAWRGGPMKYADLLGLDRVYQKVCEFYGRFGYHWRPAPLLEQLAKEGSSFSAYDQSKAKGQ